MSRAQGAKSRPQSASSHRRTDSNPDERLPGPAAQLEESECLAELKEGILALLAKKPDDPLLFLAGFFSDRVCSSFSAVSNAYCCICKDFTSQAQFMDNVTEAFAALQADNGNTQGAKREHYNLLLEKLIGARFPLTIAHMQQVARHMGKNTSIVNFSDFNLSMQMVLMIRQLQRHGTAASRESFYQEGAEDSLMLPRHVLLDVVKQFKGGLDQRKDSHTSSAKVLNASEKLPPGNTDDLDSFICRVLSMAASPFPAAAAATTVTV